MKTSYVIASAVAAVVLGLAGCTGIPADALKLGPDSLANRQMQSRAFEGVGEPAMLSTCAGVLQDLGFTLEESETKLGVIVATKERSAVNAAEVAAKITMGVVGFLWDPFMQNVRYSQRQVIRASLVCRPLSPGAKQSHAVRVTFQRRIYDNRGQIVAQQKINESALYTEFYSRLGSSVRLEALSL